MNSCVHKIIFGIVVTSLVPGSSVLFSMPKKSKQKSDDLVLQEALMMRQNEDSARRQTLHDFPLISRVFPEKNVHAFSEKFLLQNWLKEFGPFITTDNYLRSLESAYSLVKDSIECFEIIAELNDNRSCFWRYEVEAKNKLIEATNLEANNHEASIIDDVNYIGVRDIVYAFDGKAKAAKSTRATSYDPRHAFSYDPRHEIMLLENLLCDPSISQATQALVQGSIVSMKLYWMVADGMIKLLKLSALYKKNLKFFHLWEEKKTRDSLLCQIHEDFQRVEPLVSLDSHWTKESCLAKEDALWVAHSKRTYQEFAERIDQEMKKISASARKKQPADSALLALKMVQRNQAAVAKKKRKKQHNSTSSQSQQLQEASETSSSSSSCERIESSGHDAEPAMKLSDNVASEFDTAPEQTSVYPASSRTISPDKLRTPPVFITYYWPTTVSNWFDSEKLELAICREAERYKKVAVDDVWRKYIESVHTFPLIVDDFIEKLAKKYTLKCGDTLYVIPGAIKIPGLNGDKDQIGYFSWKVNNRGICFHRSFTEKAFRESDDLDDKNIYTEADIYDVIARTDLLHPTTTTTTTILTSGRTTLVSNGFVIIVTEENTGRQFKLVISDSESAVS